MLPQRGNIFIEKEIGERNRPRIILSKGENLLSDGIEFATKNVIT